MSTSIPIPSQLKPTIVYPEDNGEPMSENTLQFKWIVLIKEGLEHVFRDDPNVFIAGDLLWYPLKEDLVNCMAPDAMVIFGRPKGDRTSYVQCLEDDLPPRVVFEILSPSNRAGKMKIKRDFYERHGVEEYYEYDPDKGTLEGWLRVGDRFQPIAEMDGFVSPRLGIRFEPGVGPNNLTILDPDGEPFRTLDDHAQRSKDEKRRADAADQRAEQLAARLRALGIDPDHP